jgi:hypothetical protein
MIMFIEFLARDITVAICMMLLLTFLADVVGTAHERDGEGVSKDYNCCESSQVNGGAMKAEDKWTWLGVSGFCLLIFTLGIFIAIKHPSFLDLKHHEVQRWVVAGCWAGFGFSFGGAALALKRGNPQRYGVIESLFGLAVCMRAG